MRREVERLIAGVYPGELTLDLALAVESAREG